MKWIFLLALIGAVPVLVGWLNENRDRAHYVWVWFGFLPFFTDPWHLLTAPISWGSWPGYTKGLEITVLDALALAVVLSKPTHRYRLPFKPAFVVYIIAVAISLPHSTVPTASSFYVWQLVRVFLTFAAVARIAASDRGVIALITGMVLGIVVQSGYAVSARAAGAIQTGGSMVHQNLLGMMSHLVIMPSFALILANRYTKIGIAGVLFGVLAVILTASRASIGFAAGGLVLVYVLSVLRRPTRRKGSLGILFAVGLTVAYPFAQSSLQRRFDSTAIARADADGYDERAAFQRAANEMIKDHPFGVGPNMYVTMANLHGYSQRAGVIWNKGSRSANVHNVYLLVTAETGYLGIAAFLFLLGSALFTAFSTIWRFRADPRSDLLVGVGVGLLVVATHSLFEWIFVTYSAQYIFAIACGLIAGVRYQMQTTDDLKLHQEVKRAPLVKLPKLQPARRVIGSSK
jgi:O-antigen ligase